MEKNTYTFLAHYTEKDSDESDDQLEKMTGLSALKVLECVAVAFGFGTDIDSITITLEKENKDGN